MKWEKKGLVFKAASQHPWLATHAQLPVGDLISEDTIRVYFAGRNVESISSIGYVDLDIKNNFKVIALSETPVLEPGPIGFFDEHGVFPASIITVGNRKYLYYIGWNKGYRQPLFYSSIGLAISEDNGKTFTRYSKAPIMSRSEFDPCLVTSPHVFIEGGIWRMTYVSGVKWTKEGDALKSHYHIKYAESNDGVNWKREGRVCIDFRDELETNIARSCVIKSDDRYKMWYCYVYGTSKYRMGFAESSDMVSWKRRDDVSGISVSNDGFDSEMICYPNILRTKDLCVLLYNGNNFGKDGFGVAISNEI